MKRALVISGGGLNGLAGLAQASRLSGIDGRHYDIYTGESIGAVCAFMLPLMGAQNAMAYWMREIKAANVYKGGGWLDWVKALAGWRDGAWDMTPSLDTIRHAAKGMTWPADVTSVVTVTDLAAGRLTETEITSASDLNAVARDVWRSCLVPLAHNTDGRLADGGVMATAPLAPAIKRGAQAIDVIMLSPMVPEPRPEMDRAKARDKAGRAVDLLRRRLLWADLELARRVNQAPAKGERVIDVTIYQPMSKLPGWMDASYDANVRRLEARFKRQTLGEAVDDFRRLNA